MSILAKAGIQFLPLAKGDYEGFYFCLWILVQVRSGIVGCLAFACFLIFVIWDLFRDQDLEIRVLVVIVQETKNENNQC
jgi:hypothetical protein